MNRIPRIWLAIAMLCTGFMCSQELKADLLIDVQDASIQAGSDGFVDVLISTNTDVLVSGFDLSFAIAPVGTTFGTLTFVASPDTSYATDPNYLLLGAGNLFLNPSGLTLTGSDADTNNHSLTTSTAKLLVRLHLLHELPFGGTAAQAATDQFTITADLSGGSFNIYDETTAPITQLTGSSGTVSIYASAAVPEPQVWIAGLLCSGIVLLRNRWRTRK